MKRAGFILIAAAALVLRLIWVFSINNPEVGETPWFHQRAIGFIEQGSYHFEGVPTAFFPVGFPLFLSIIYRIAGASMIAAKIANVILGTILCLATAMIAKKIFNPRAGMIAGWIMVFYPNNIFYTSIVMSEVLLAMLITISLLFILLAQGRKWLIISSGILVGFCVLVRSVSIILPLCFLIDWIFLEKTAIKESLLRFLMLFFGLSLVLCPWIIRNYKVMNQFVLVSTNGGMNFWMAHLHGGSKVHTILKLIHLVLN